MFVLVINVWVLNIDDSIDKRVINFCIKFKVEDQDKSVWP